MRSKFIVQIPHNSKGEFPTDEEVRVTIRSYGWEPADIASTTSEVEKVTLYKTKADKLFTEGVMPEVAHEEKDYVIFFGQIASDQTKFIVTRSVSGLITYRLLQEELHQLISATEKLVRNVISKSVFSLKGVSVSIENNNILVYEKGHNHVILEGRVVENTFVETIKTNPKDALVMFLVVIFGTISFSVHNASENNLVTPDQMDKISLSVIAVALVSLVGIVLTFVNIKKNRIVSWNLKKR